MSFEEFQNLAQNESLDKYQKIGFPREFRESYEEIICDDIVSKVSNLLKPNASVLDIGPGCSDLPRLLISRATEVDSQVTLIDSDEMLNLLPNQRNVIKIAGKFQDVLRNEMLQTYDAIICYSVFQYIYYNSSTEKFVDEALSLLKPGGQLLIGDIPNFSKRKRMLSTPEGGKYHQEYMKTDSQPDIKFAEIASGLIDDSTVVSIISRARAAGFDSYVLPQPHILPMSNRREDILICRPI